MLAEQMSAPRHVLKLLQVCVAAQVFPAVQGSSVVHVSFVLHVFVMLQRSPLQVFVPHTLFWTQSLFKLHVLATASQTVQPAAFAADGSAARDAAVASRVLAKPRRVRRGSPGRPADSLSTSCPNLT